MDLGDGGEDEFAATDWCTRFADALEAAVARGASHDEAVTAARRSRYLPPEEQLAAIRNCAARRH